MYESGIEFFDINADAKAVLGKYINAFNAQ